MRDDGEQIVPQLDRLARLAVELRGLRGPAAVEGLCRLGRQVARVVLATSLQQAVRSVRETLQSVMWS